MLSLLRRVNWPADLLGALRWFFMLAFIMIELFAKGLIEARHLGLEACGVEGFADGGVEGVAVEKGLESGGNGVQVLLRADFT